MTPQDLARFMAEWLRDGGGMYVGSTDNSDDLTYMCVDGWLDMVEFAQDIMLHLRGQL